MRVRPITAVLLLAVASTAAGCTSEKPPTDRHPASATDPTSDAPAQLDRVGACDAYSATRSALYDLEQPVVQQYLSTFADSSRYTADQKALIRRAYHAYQADQVQALAVRTNDERLHRALDRMAGALRRQAADPQPDESEPSMVDDSEFMKLCGAQNIRIPSPVVNPSR